MALRAAYHMLVSAGLALIAVSVSDLVKPDSSKSGTGLLRGGFAIFFISWVLLALATLFSMKRPASYSQLTNDKSFRDGTLVRTSRNLYIFKANTRRCSCSTPSSFLYPCLS
jgi:hypothetical protein